MQVDLVPPVEDLPALMARRDETQPTKDLSAGSTFRNPAGFSSTGQADDSHDLTAWKVIDHAGATVTYDGQSNRVPMQLASRGTVFLPLRHTELTTGSPRSIARTSVPCG